MKDVNLLRNWLTSKSIETYEPPELEKCMLLYETTLFGSGLAAVINGESLPARFKTEPGWYQFNWLIEILGRTTSREAAVWFDVRYNGPYDPQVGFLMECDFDKLQSIAMNRDVQDVLLSLELGASTILLAPYSKNWFLEISKEDSPSLKIFLHGSKEFCSVVGEGLGL